MRAALVYNAGAGTATSENALIAALEEAGWRITHRLDERGLPDVPSGLDAVIVAGGDGTVATVAKVIGPRAIPMAIVPMGTVNNVARSLGIGVDTMSAAAGLCRTSETRLDLGTLRAAGKSIQFVEGFGVGVFAHVIGEVATEEHKTLRKAHGLLADELEDYPPRHIELEVDGNDLSGEYLLVAAMNVRSLGPALSLAPDAKCDDGELDLIRVRPESKDSLLAHLRRAADQGDITLPMFESCRAKTIRLRSDGRWAHLDDEPWKLEHEVEIGVMRGAVRVLVPSP